MRKIDLNKEKIIKLTSDAEGAGVGVHPVLRIQAWGRLRRNRN